MEYVILFGIIFFMAYVATKMENNSKF